MTRGRAVLAVLVIGVLVLGAFAGCAKKEAEKPSGQAGPAPKVIRLACGMPTGYNLYHDVQRIASRVGELSKGALKVEVYGEGSLIKDQDAMEAVTTGAVEMVSIPAFWVARVAPLFSLFELPGLFPSPEVIRQVYDGDLGAQMGEQLKEKGAVLLGFSDFWVEYIGYATKKPVYVPKDLKGMKLRAGTTTDKLVMEACGAQPVSLSGAELYMALQRGTIDGAMVATSQLSERKLYEVVKYLTNLRITQVPYPVMINRRFFESLPADQQKVLADVVREACLEGRAEVGPQEARWIDDCKKNGVTLITPTPEQWAQWQELFDRVVYPAYFQKVPELESMVAQVKKWLGGK
ncbi:MAG: TRAP transporter substrate-binding protein [Firmicutes bacterium]|nr:TRAP transporter substrate-binding protein [Bacillota bacterium]